MLGAKRHDARVSDQRAQLVHAYVRYVNIAEAVTPWKVLWGPIEFW